MICVLTCFRDLFERTSVCVWPSFVAVTNEASQSVSRHSSTLARPCACLLVLSSSFSVVASSRSLFNRCTFVYLLVLWAVIVN